MRWLFILLLLVNAVYFSWQMQSSEELHIAKPVPADVARLRLLSEVDQSLLLSRELPQQKVQEVQEVSLAQSWCQVIEGIASLNDAEELQLKLLAAGVESSISVSDEEQVLAYELIVRQPSAAEADVALLSNIKAMGLAVERIPLNGGSAYILGRYGKRSEVNQAQERLSGVLRSEIYQVVSKDGLYQVWIDNDEVSETPNKINDLREYFQHGIKIEKKVCKGVASTGVRD